jgi:acetylglutamate kinase
MAVEHEGDAAGVERGIGKGALPRARHRHPDTILLYREPMLLESIETGKDLFPLVRIELLHEVRRHFSLSDEDI